MVTSTEYLDSRLLAEEINPALLNWKARQIIAEIMKDFADEHVRRALELSSKAARIEDQDGHKSIAFMTNNFGPKGYVSASIDKHSITNAYPKIKYIL